MIHAIVGTRMHDYNRALYDHRTEADVLLEKEKDGRTFFSFFRPAERRK